jgi:hypothetical protein
MYIGWCQCICFVYFVLHTQKYDPDSDAADSGNKSYATVVAATKS